MHFNIIAIVLLMKRILSGTEEAPVPPDRDRGFQVQHEAKQQEGWSLPNKGGEPPLVTGNNFFVLATILSAQLAIAIWLYG